MKDLKFNKRMIRILCSKIRLDHNSNKYYGDFTQVECIFLYDSGLCTNASSNWEYDWVWQDVNLGNIDGRNWIYFNEDLSIEDITSTIWKKFSKKIKRNYREDVCNRHGSTCWLKNYNEKESYLCIHCRGTGVKV